MQTKEKTVFADTTKIPFERAGDTAVFDEALRTLETEYSCVHTALIGESIMGRPITAVTLGSDRRSRGVLFVGGMCGDDAFSPGVLLRFIRDYAEFLESGKRICSVSLPYLYAHRSIHIIPMLNPDGYSIRKHGVGDIPIGDRLIKINGNSDFSSWRKNARGTALYENFTDCKGSEFHKLMAESEPECAALCQYIRMTENGFYGNLELVMELHGRNSYLKCTSGDISASRSKTVARLISRMTGCEVNKNCDNSGELCDFFLREIGRPAFSCGFARADSEIASVHDEFFRIYASFREALFSAPLLI